VTINFLTTVSVYNIGNAVLTHHCNINIKIMYMLFYRLLQTENNIMKVLVDDT